MISPMRPENPIESTRWELGKAPMLVDPAFIIKVDKRLSDEDYEHFRERWLAEYGSGEIRPVVEWQRGTVEWLRPPSLRERIGRKVGGWIAGVDLSKRAYE